MRLKLTAGPAWKKRSVGDLTVYESSTVAWLPGIVQGYTTRNGGVSEPPYDSLNLADHVGDSPERVAANRERIWADLGFSDNSVVMAEQVHGAEVAVVSSGSDGKVAGVDALITDTPGLLLVLFYADCVPVYIVDPLRRAIGLIHAGWRGTASNIVDRTIKAMAREFGCKPKSCLAAVGPCIAADSYEVGPDVADRFRNFSVGMESGAAVIVQPRDELGGTYSLDLRQMIFAQLMNAGIRAEYISVCNRDTFRSPRDFFSYRRDGVTGRNAAYLAMRPD